MNVIVPGPNPVIYPESDGLPMADNTRQGWWMVLLFSNLDALFRNAPDVFVAINVFWYPVEGESEERNAPDVLVVFGRPKGHRSSYRQWEEGDIPVTVVFEILSPGNTPLEMADKYTFYELNGVEEYYIYDPEHNHLIIHQRKGQVFRRARPANGFVSPRMGIRFDLSGPEMVVYDPQGQPFRPLSEEKTDRLAAEQRTEQEKQRAEQEKQRAEQEKQRAEQEKQRAEQQTQRAEQEKQRAEQQTQRAEQEKQRAEQEKQRAEQQTQRSARLGELSRKARRQQATPEELAELERLEDESVPPSS
jgi:Uma2 family endonuclease